MSCHFLFEFTQVTGKVAGQISKAEGMALYISVVFDTTFYGKGLLKLRQNFQENLFLRFLLPKHFFKRRVINMLHFQIN